MTKKRLPKISKDNDLVTCRKCGKEKPRADFKEYVFRKVRNSKGVLVEYKNITPCYDCRCIERRSKYGVDRTGKPRTRPEKGSSYRDVNYGFVFESDPNKWCNGNIIKNL
jgi:hypothetical protein